MNRVLSIFAAILVSACSRATHKPAYTEAEVREFIQSGTPREAIIARFGEPLITEKNPKFDGGWTGVDEIIYYLLPPGDEQRERKEDWAFAGFQVRLKEGKTVDWASTHSN
jgi:hypothetical protein